MGGHTLDITNQRFGHLLVVSFKDSVRGHSRWNCVCDCGRTCIIFSCCLRLKTRHRTTTCGKCGLATRKHGLYADGNLAKARLFSGAKQRATKFGILFSITHADIVVPTTCPLLNIPLTLDAGKRTENTATLDRIIPRNGYVQGNIAVMSWRANRIKNDATIEELEQIVVGLKRLRSDNSWSEAK